MNLLPVRSTEEDKLPWSKNSIYKFSSENLYPRIIIRVGGKLFIDIDEFEALARRKRDEQVGKKNAAWRRVDK
ncbi:MAG TPA: hypothetical protein ENH24_03485 [Nitrospirae bacterium]|nr:hypothetical protein [Nitrospirota bacterium]